MRDERNPITENQNKRFGRIHLIMIPARDPQASRDFYARLGFETQSEVELTEDYPWIEMSLPESEAGVVFVKPTEAAADGVATGILITTDDIDSAHTELRDAGADTDEEIARAGSDAHISLGGSDMVEPFPPMFYVRDPDGNSMLIVEPAE